MSLLIESKKLKRTGYLPAFLAGGFLAAAFPVVYMMVKAEEMTALSGNPINILMSANWQMMAMLNILISICGACMMYHTEYADNGIPYCRIEHKSVINFISPFFSITLSSEKNENRRTSIYSSAAFSFSIF